MGRCRFLLYILRGTDVGAVEFFSTFYKAQQWAFSISAGHLTWHRIWRCRVVLDILYGREFGAVEYCSIFYFVQKLVRSSSVRQYTCYSRGSWRVLLDIVHVKNWALTSSSRNSTRYRSGGCRGLLYILQVTVAAAVEVCWTLYMVKHWPLSSTSRHSTC